jgi:carbon monoxide dehydrogenase subunit G
MILDNEITVQAAPDKVFALFNEVERVATCMPGAMLDGQDGDAWLGRVKVKVGPITAAYAGSVRFLEVDPAARRLRLTARGADTHGSGDAEAAVDLIVEEAPGGSGGSLVRLRTDLLVRGKIVQFGKGAIVTVSDKILQQFALNLAGLLDHDQVTAAAPAAGPAHADTTRGSTPDTVQAPVPVTARPSAPPPVPAAAELDGLAMFAGPAFSKYGPAAAALVLGLAHGWLLCRLRDQRRQIRSLQQLTARRPG